MVKKRNRHISMIALIAVTVYSIDSYCAYKVFERESIYFEETEITD